MLTGSVFLHDYRHVESRTFYLFRLNRRLD